MPSHPSADPATAPPPHLAPAHWTAAGRTLLARTVAEMAYEEMVIPVPDGPPGRWRIALPQGVSYSFEAHRGTFGAWRVRPETLLRRAGDRDQPATDPTRFVVDAADVLGLSRSVVADLVRDLTATHAADARLHARAIPAGALADLSHEDLEAHQTGHPCMFVNKGRLGFSSADTARYTPEAAGDFRLVWIAVTPELGRFTAVPGLDRSALLADELDPVTRAAFAERIRDRGGDPEAYVWLPVHPFQWDEVVLPLFAAQIAQGSLVYLGESVDRYRPLQSIRTLTNLDRPRRRNVKVPLMIRNTLVWRGLSQAQTTCAPRLTTWLRDLRDGDGFLRDECRVVMLGEVASVTVPHPTFEALPDAPYRYQELLGAIWREPVHGHLEPGERARTMAALLLEGSDGRAVVAELVARSGLGAREWLRAYVGALLPPLLHYLYRYGASFTPHGENVVLISDAAERPTRIALKDFGADVELLPFDLPEYARIPSEARDQLHRWPARDLAHSILSAICAGHFRFLTDIAQRHLGVPEREFWSLVREPIEAYHRRFPELSDRFTWFDLLGPEFGRVALNREQLLGGGFHDRAERDAEFDVMYGTVLNPLHAARTDGD
ncbi:siderophore synthetase component [Micromonospora pisi]|uniref:Siderophore synthetase component n=1 Tax=Micromonospora pisi TaxID=589240 RepID=A0A495JTV1_9ACTN|nr:IucA/IucC family protein [Micromonospora pisi]RKR92437.1 siderophore synthetase component [Micromonospora pisi]